MHFCEKYEMKRIFFFRNSKCNAITYYLYKLQSKLWLRQNSSFGKFLLFIVEEDNVIQDSNVFIAKEGDWK